MVEGLFSQWIDEVSCSLASLIHIFDPPLVVLGGGSCPRRRPSGGSKTAFPISCGRATRGTYPGGGAGQPGRDAAAIWRWSSQIPAESLLPDRNEGPPAGPLPPRHFLLCG